MRVSKLLAIAMAASGIAACAATPLQVSDGGAIGSESGDGADSASDSTASGCIVVLASDYDQSCVVDTDCVSVGQVAKCPVTDCSGCYLVAINKGAAARYMTALSQAVVSGPPGPICNCPCESGFAICRGGQCQAAPCGPPPGDTLAACSDAGGLCVYRANATCGGTALPGGCAYSDEMCCLN